MTVTYFPDPDEEDSSIQPDQGCISLQIELSYEVWQRLVDKSDDTHRTQNDIMETALIFYLNHLSWLKKMRQNLEDTYES